MRSVAGRLVGMMIVAASAIGVPVRSVVLKSTCCAVYGSLIDGPRRMFTLRDRITWPGAMLTSSAGAEYHWSVAGDSTSSAWLVDGVTNTATTVAARARPRRTARPVNE